MSPDNTHQQLGQDANFSMNYQDTLKKRFLNYMESVSLKPCPFCGGKPGPFRSSPETWGHGKSGNQIGVRCKSCLCKLSKSSYVGDKELERLVATVLMWNRRTSENHG